MELVYLWVEDYKNIKKQGFNFSPRFKCEYDEEKNKLTIDENKDYVSIFPENINITAIVGENGSGKSSILEVISTNSIPSILIIKQDNKLIINKRKINFNFLVLTNQVYKFEEKIHMDLAYVSLSHFLNSNDSDSNHYVSMDYELMPVNWTNGYNEEVKENNKYILNLIAFLDESNNYLDFLLLKNKFKYIQFNYSRNTFISDFIEDNKDFLINNKNFKSFEIFLYLLIGNYKSFDDIEDKDYFLNEAILKKYISQIETKNLNKIKAISNNIEYLSYKTAIISINGLTELRDIMSILIIKEDIDIFEILLLNEKKEKVEFSSGEYTNLFYHANNPKEKSFLLIDEIDLYNHPNWQIKYINKITSQHKNQHIILTSHSPFILSDLPKENVIFLAKGKQVYPFGDNQQTFGANIHTLLSHGFFMKDGLMGEFAKSKISKILKFLNEENKYIDLEVKILPPLKIQNNFFEKNLKPIIKFIGEDFLREKLLKMYEIKFPKSNEVKIRELENEIKRLKNASN